MRYVPAHPLAIVQIANGAVWAALGALNLLALAALATCLYSGRMIRLVFLGEANSEAAEHAQHHDGTARPGRKRTRTDFYETAVDEGGRTIADVLREIAEGFLRGTPNGIRVDAESALVWSPSHFTWMDTNYPAGTPRQGYPVEIQALWIRLLRQLDRLGIAPAAEAWGELAARAEASLHELFWLPEQGWFADCLLARPGGSARLGTNDPDGGYRPPEGTVAAVLALDPRKAAENRRLFSELRRAVQNTAAMKPRE